MKLVLSSILSVLILAQCTQKESQSANSDLSAQQKPAAGSSVSDSSQPVNKSVNVLNLEGLWSETKKERVGDDSVTAIISVKLLPNGDFVAMAEIRSKLNKNKPSFQSQTGKWTFDGKIVNLGGKRQLIYQSDPELLVDAPNNVHLSRQ